MQALAARFSGYAGASCCCFLEKGFKNCLTNTLEKAAIENARSYVQDSLLALGRKFRLREQELGMEDQSFQ
jgi:hypothetical protein